MPIETYEAWLSLYSGVGLVVAICAVVAVVKTLVDCRTGDLNFELGSTTGRLLFVPKLWWRWQTNYLTGAPVVLFIAFLYANYIGFDVLGDV